MRRRLGVLVDRSIGRESLRVEVGLAQIELPSVGTTLAFDLFINETF